MCHFALYLHISLILQGSGPRFTTVFSASQWLLVFPLRFSISLFILNPYLMVITLANMQICFQASPLKSSSKYCQSFFINTNLTLTLIKSFQSLSSPSEQNDQSFLLNTAYKNLPTVILIWELLNFLSFL